MNYTFLLLVSITTFSYAVDMRKAQTNIPIDRTFSAKIKRHAALRSVSSQWPQAARYPAPSQEGATDLQAHRSSKKMKSPHANRANLKRAQTGLPFLKAKR